MLMVIQKFDNAILDYIKNNMHTVILDKTMIIITSLGNSGFIWIIIAVFLITNKKYRNIGLMTLCALLISAIMGEEILKHVFQRARPCANVPAVNLLITKPLTYSFPSGHAALSFAASGVLSKYLKKYSYVFFTLASFIAFSRVYLYVHYPTDVLAGVVLGLVCSKIAIYIFEKIRL